MKRYQGYPVHHIDGNLAFTKKGAVWSYYKIIGFGYENRDEKGKHAPFSSQLEWLVENNSDLHFVVQPLPINTDTILDNTIQSIRDLKHDHPLKNNGIQFMNAVKTELRKHQTDRNSTEYHAILGVQIRKGFNEVKESNLGNTAIKGFTRFIKGLSSPLFQAAGLHPDDLLQSDIDAYHEEADTLETVLATKFDCKVKKLTASEFIYFSEQNYSVGMEEIEKRTGFQTAEVVEGTDFKGKNHKAKRPNPVAFYDLQTSEVQEYDRTTLLIQREVNEEIEDTFVQYLVCHKINGVPKHPGFEWVYELQNKLDFPVTFSIRAEHVPNDKTKKMLTNTRLTIDDQIHQAEENGVKVHSDVKTADSNVNRMQDIFSNSEWPSYQCSYLFRVAAKDRSTLKARVSTLKSRLGKYKMQIIAPFGSQLDFFYESILGSHRYNRDYTKPVAPNVLAGMMFGATNNIGDGQGFYFAQTAKQRKPVFVRLDLAAKNFEHIDNLHDSLAVMVAGATGKGKSMLMNLMAYLSVLMGAYALVIDPKGDKDWSKGLPYIPKEYINVWTLGKVEEDNGCLDPFRICETLEEARDLALEVISHSSSFDTGSLQYAVLGDIVETAIHKYDDACMGAIIKHAQEMKAKTKIEDPIYTAVYQVEAALRNLRNSQLGKLLISDMGQKTKVLSIDTPIQVMMIQGLQLRENGLAANTPMGKISEAIMVAITAFTKHFMINNDRSIHKVILQDEASSIERSETGAQLLDYIKRKGRWHNTSLLEGSQNSTDFDSDTNNIGMKFSFTLNSEKEAVEMLKYFNLPVTNENITELQSMPKGYCFFQDIWGRTSKIKVNPLFTSVFEAFNSSTSTEEEREREREKVLQGVGV